MSSMIWSGHESRGANVVAVTAYAKTPSLSLHGACDTGKRWSTPSCANISFIITYDMRTLSTTGPQTASPQALDTCLYAVLLSSPRKLQN
eukprot:2402663-Amphidinium_carterae.1